MSWNTTAALVLLFVISCYCNSCKDEGNFHVTCACDSPTTQLYEILGNFTEPAHSFSLTITSCLIENATLPAGAENVTIYYNGYLFVQHFSLSHVTTLQFRNVSCLKLEQFSFKQADHLEILRFDNIDQLEIGSGTFSLFTPLKEMTIEHSNMHGLKENVLSFNVTQFRLSESKLTCDEFNSVHVSADVAILQQNTFYIVHPQSIAISANGIIFKENIVHKLRGNGLVFHGKKFTLSDNEFTYSETDAFSSITFPDDGEFFEFSHNKLKNLPETSLLDMDFRPVALSMDWVSHLKIHNNTIPCSCIFVKMNDRDKSISSVRNAYYEQFRQGQTKCMKSSEMLNEFLENHCSKSSGEHRVPAVPDHVNEHEHEEHSSTDGRITSEFSPMTQATVGGHEHEDYNYDEMMDKKKTRKNQDEDHVFVPRKASVKKLSRNDEYDYNEMHGEVKGQSTTAKPSTDSSTGHVIGPVIIVIIAILIMVGILICIFLKYRKIKNRPSKG